MARSFNGTSDLISANTAHVTNGGALFTVAFWAKSSLAHANALDLYAEANSGAAGPFFQIQGTASGTVTVGMRSGTSGSADTFSGTTVAFDGTWHHIAVRQTTANNLALLVDGVGDAVFQRTNLSDALNQVFNTCTFGAIHRNTTSGFYGGVLAEVANWTRTLSTREISSLASGLPASHFGPSHYWPLWGVDSPEPDIGNG